MLRVCRCCMPQNALSHAWPTHVARQAWTARCAARTAIIAWLLPVGHSVGIRRRTLLAQGDVAPYGTETRKMRPRGQNLRGG